MSLHSLIEPAGTLQTGWKLTDKDSNKADIRNRDEVAPLLDPAPEASPATTRSKWELGKVR